MKFFVILFINSALFISTISAQENSFPNPSINQTEQSVVSLPANETESSQNSQPATYTRPSADKRFKRYLNQSFGPPALFGAGASAAFSTATNRPEEWGKSTTGFGRRFASNMGRNLIRETTIYGLDEAFKLDSGFYKSRNRSVGSRINNAVVSTFTARKTNGKRVVGVPRLVGTYTSHIIAAETWYPKRFDYRDGLRSGSISLGINVGFNLLREFIFKK